jgi:hypothetical protein
MRRDGQPRKRIKTERAPFHAATAAQLRKEGVRWLDLDLTVRAYV